MPPLAISTYYAVPLARTVWPQAGRVNPPLRERLLTWERDEGKRSSVPTEVPKHAVYESDFSLFFRDDPIIAELAQWCLSCLGELIMRINRYTPAEMQNLRIYHHSWYHVTRHGGYTGMHDHPMASWSGVYCVTPGETRDDLPDSGLLRLHDTRAPSMYLDPGNARLVPPYATGTVPLRLKEGELVLFPSWLMHEVTPFKGRDERITIAFNAWVREAGQAVDEPGVRLNPNPAA